MSYICARLGFLTQGLVASRTVQRALGFLGKAWFLLGNWPSCSHLISARGSEDDKVLPQTTVPGSNKPSGENLAREELRRDMSELGRSRGG